MIILILLQLVFFGFTTSSSKGTETCPEDWIPISDKCWEFNTIVMVPFKVAEVLCKEDGGLISVQADPVEVGQYIAKEHPGKIFWAGATTTADTCISFGGQQRAYVKEDCGSLRYYICHMQKQKPKITEPESKHKGVGHHISQAFQKGWKSVKDVFTYDEEELLHERVVEGCQPMMYNGVLHTGCTTRGSSDGKYWCGTEGGIFWPGISKWKYC